MKRVCFVSYLMMLWTLGVVDADAAAPVGSADAHIKGVFGEVFPWPINAIHVTLLPDGKVYSFGAFGPRSAALWHGVWDPEFGDPELGTHTQVSKFTPTNSFCSAHALLPNSGELLITGGDIRVNNQEIYGDVATDLYDYNAQTLNSAVEPMAYQRWYPTLVPWWNGELLVLGGRQGTDPPVHASTPEVYTPEGPNKGWRTLTTATNGLAYGSSNGSWYYPRAFPAPNGQVFILAHHGEMFYLNPTGTGSITLATTTLAPASHAGLPSVNFAPGQIISLRHGKRAIIVDLNKAPPTFEDTAPVSSIRNWSNLTVLADGTVMISGGSEVANTLINVAYTAEIWDPATGTWTPGAAAQIPRLYHSSAVLLPDATILTMGGGNPGPLTNLNAEVYYPAYLWEPNASGSELAKRPSIESAPDTVAMGDEFNLTVGSGDSIERVTLVRNGSVTHSFDAATSFTELSFIQSGTNLTITAPENANVAMPGYWMIFVINQNGVPSVAKILHLPTITESSPPPPPVTPPPPPVTCRGVNATIVGTDGDDVINGTSARDVIAGLGGRDTIRGFGGNDLICAGSGNDVVHGGAGNDIIYGQAGRDTLNGNGGSDRLTCGSGRDTARGGSGSDTATACEVVSRQ